jgi:ABC-type bacteriocin/lantibiotic exporter with double-glycine peptidase domain
MGRSTCRRGVAVVVLVVAGVTVFAAVGVARHENPARHLAARVRGGRLVDWRDGVAQVHANDCGPAALAHCLRRMGRQVPYPDPHCDVRLGPRGCGFEELVREAGRLGVPARHRRVDTRELDRICVPAVLYLSYGHFVALEEVDRSGRVIVHDPALGRVEFSPGAVRRLWSGDVLEFVAEGVP